MILCRDRDSLTARTRWKIAVLSFSVVLLLRSSKDNVVALIEIQNWREEIFLWLSKPLQQLNEAEKKLFLHHRARFIVVNKFLVSTQPLIWNQIVSGTFSLDDEFFSLLISIQTRENFFKSARGRFRTNFKRKLFSTSDREWMKPEINLVSLDFDANALSFNENIEEMRWMELIFSPH